MDAEWFGDHWWLLFPILGFVIAFYSMWLDHRRRRDWMDVMKTYAAQGKEPPASLMGGPPGDHWRGWGNFPPPTHSWRGTPFWDVRRGILMGVLAVAFGYLYYYRPDHNEGFGIAAVILGALAVGFLLIAMFRPKSNGTTPPPSNGH